MTTSQQNLEDRLRRVLSEQAQALQVDRPEWQPAAVTVATRRTGRSHGSPRLAVGLGVAITLLIAIGAIVLVVTTPLESITIPPLGIHRAQLRHPTRSCLRLQARQPGSSATPARFI